MFRTQYRQNTNEANTRILQNYAEAADREQTRSLLSLTEIIGLTHHIECSPQQVASVLRQRLTLDKVEKHVTAHEFVMAIRLHLLELCLKRSFYPIIRCVNDS
jgi:hypothetical protein